MKSEIRESLELLSASAVVIVAVVLITLLCSCTRTVYEPVERVKTEYKDADTTAIYNRLLKLFESRRENETRSDSLVDRQKETVVLNVQGDTVKLTRTHYVYVSSKREKELEVENKMLRDSVSVLETRFESIKTDSIPVIVPVERKLSRWEKAKMDFGGIAIGAVIVSLCFAVVWLIKKFRKEIWTHYTKY